MPAVLGKLSTNGDAANRCSKFVVPFTHAAGGRAQESASSLAPPWAGVLRASQPTSRVYLLPFLAEPSYPGMLQVEETAHNPTGHGRVYRNFLRVQNQAVEGSYKVLIYLE